MTSADTSFETARSLFASLNDRLEFEWFERYPARIDEPEFAALTRDTAEAYTALERALGRKPRAADIEIVDASEETDGEPLFELELFGTKIGYLTTDLGDIRRPYLNDIGWRFTGMGLTRDSVEHDRTLLVKYEGGKYPPAWKELSFVLDAKTVRRAQRCAKSEALSRLKIARARTRSREKLPV